MKLTNSINQPDQNKFNDEFYKRGFSARDKAKQTGKYIDADVVVSKLQEKLKHHQPNK